MILGEDGRPKWAIDRKFTVFVALYIVMSIFLIGLLIWLFRHHTDSVPCPDHNSVYQVTVDDDRNIVTCKVKL